ncbi:hypothetical protein E8D34_08605 [Nocardioides sp. GY 10113]|uniref:hypothetical protein n=1 Tax=Nocardioides sp. GY 10113 TaxID=2569761 RepID=UPI0010A7DCDF|nr:hypothetical protein [Nocardioides sp. GY 10113]TIC87727.1 hypothetical protein E8D34_08605 [Nocardioides sp. GY 10113]
MRTALLRALWSSVLTFAVVASCALVLRGQPARPVADLAPGQRTDAPAAPLGADRVARLLDAADCWTDAAPAASRTVPAHVVLQVDGGHPRLRGEPWVGRALHHVFVKPNPAFRVYGFCP